MRLMFMLFCWNNDKFFASSNQLQSLKILSRKNVCKCSTIFNQMVGCAAIKINRSIRLWLCNTTKNIFIILYSRLKKAYKMERRERVRESVVVMRMWFSFSYMFYIFRPMRVGIVLVVTIITRDSLHAMS